jgi:hypothetical protein
MKKVLLLLSAVATLSASAQKSKMEYKIGVLSPLPVNVYQNVKLYVGSSLVEMSYKYSNKVRMTLTSGFLRFQNELDKDFTNVPVMAGARYSVNNTVYFGASAGVAFFNKEASVDSRIMYSPYIGIQKGHVSADLQYINWYKFDNANNNLALCISYTL